MLVDAVSEGLEGGEQDKNAASWQDAGYRVGRSRRAPPGRAPALFGAGAGERGLRAQLHRARQGRPRPPHGAVHPARGPVPAVARRRRRADSRRLPARSNRADGNVIRIRDRRVPLVPVAATRPVRRLPRAGISGRCWSTIGRLPGSPNGERPYRSYSFRQLVHVGAAAARRTRSR